MTPASANSWARAGASEVLSVRRGFEQDHIAKLARRFAWNRDCSLSASPRDCPLVLPQHPRHEALLSPTATPSKGPLE